MSEIQDSEDIIVNELKKMNKRLDSMHNWIAAFIVISIFFYFYVLLLGLAF